MYASRTTTASFGRNSTMPQASLYARVGVETGIGAASPHQLVSMLFAGFAEAIAQA